MAPRIDLGEVLEASSDEDDPPFLEAASTSLSENSTLASDATSRADSTKSMESMLQKLRLNRDHKGDVDFRGTSSGTIFVQSVCGEVGWSKDPNLQPRDVYGGAPSTERSTEDSRETSLSAIELSSAVKQQKLDSPDLFDVDDEIQMPPYKVALALSRLCFERGCVVFQFNHLPTYYARLAAHYDASETGPDEDFVPVVYSAMAVGCLFLKVADPTVEVEIDDPRLRAFQYFQASKRLSDTIDRANSDVLQTLLLQVLFLQSTANMSLCWTYCGLALRNAQRMGLHRNFDDHFCPIERQLRKKQFWSIRAVELYLHAILGLPKGISEEDIDQGIPEEVDDDFLDGSESSNQPEGVTSNLVSANAYTKLGPLLSDIVSQVYPTHDAKPSGSQSRLSHEMLESFEARLTAWDESLPYVLQSTTKFSDLETRFYRQSRLLRYSYYHLYVLMYRPFLHYLGTNDEESRKFRIYGEKAKQGALGALRVTEDMLNNDPTAFGHFFAIYATFFSGLVVLYCVIQERPPAPDRSECLRYIEIAKTAMRATAPCSFAAESGLSLMNDLSSQIPSSDATADQTPGDEVRSRKSGSERTSYTTERKRDLSKSRPSLSKSSGGPSENAAGHKKKGQDDLRVPAFPNPSNVLPTGQTGPGLGGGPEISTLNTFATGTLPITSSFMPTFPNFPTNYPFQQGLPSPQFYTNDTYQPSAGRFGNLNNVGYFFDDPIQGTIPIQPPQDMYADALAQANPAFFYSGPQWPYGTQMQQQQQQQPPLPQIPSDVNDLMQYDDVNPMGLIESDVPLNVYYPDQPYRSRNSQA